MNEIVYRNEHGTPITDSYRVSKAFGKSHAAIVRVVRNLLKQDTKGTGIKRWVGAGTYTARNNKEYPMLTLNYRAYVMLALRFTGAVVVPKKMAIIREFDRLNAPQEAVREVQEKYCQHGLSQSLRNAAMYAEKIEKILLQAQQHIPKAAPKKSKAAEKDILIGTFAKQMVEKGIDTGEKRLFEWLRENKYLCKTGEKRNLPTAKALKLKLFRVKQTSLWLHGKARLCQTTMVTPKGRAYFFEKLKEEVTNERK